MDQYWLDQYFEIVENGPIILDQYLYWSKMVGPIFFKYWSKNWNIDKKTTYVCSTIRACTAIVTRNMKLSHFYQRGVFFPGDNI